MPVVNEEVGVAIAIVVAHHVGIDGLVVVQGQTAGGVEGSGTHAMRRRELSVVLHDGDPDVAHAAVSRSREKVAGTLVDEIPRPERRVHVIHTAVAIDVGGHGIDRDIRLNVDRGDIQIVPVLPLDHGGHPCRVA